MKERPILYNGEMVRAILDGRKTMTRRVVKQQPIGLTGAGSLWFNPPYKGLIYDNNEGQPDLIRRCPYGQPGDRLWVRETWLQLNGEGSEPDALCYKSDDSILWLHDGKLGYQNCKASDLIDPGNDKWKPSIFMPHWASRVTLEITEVRVERLQEISEEDVEKEGMGYLIDNGWHRPDCIQWPSRYDEKGVCCEQGGCSCPDYYDKESFPFLWDSINKKYPWESNPWVWVISFKRINP